MILLDTNVISEIMRPSPAAEVQAFLNAHPSSDLFIASVCEAEIRYGIERLPQGRRQDELRRSFVAFLNNGFGTRVLSFNSFCAQAYAALRVGRQLKGRPISQADALIAATCLAHDAAIATRNVADFADCGITIRNPWDHR